MPIIILPETGSAYVTLEEIRALPNLGDETRFTDDELGTARDWFETKFEAYTGMAFVPRTATERINGSGGSTLMLNHYPVRTVTAVRVYTSVTLNTAFTADELADILVDPTGEITRYTLGAWTYGARNIEVVYTHGQTAPPADVKREALVAIQEKLMEDHSGRPTDRTYGVATDGVFVRSILPGKDKPFGIASVDQCANEYRARYKLPAMA